MTFSAMEAALEGFKITRSRPLAVLAWAGVLFVMSFAIAALLIGLVGNQLAPLTDFKAMQNLPPEDAVKFLPAMLKVILIEVAVSLPLMAFVIASIDRAVLRPGEGAFAWLAVGADELRQIAALFCYGLALWLASFFGFLVLSVFLAIPLGALGPPGAFAGGFLAVLAAIALTIWVGVRLSLGPPATFDQRRFVLLESWTRTRGHFWELLGCYIIAWLFSILVWGLVSFLGVLVVNALPGPDPAQIRAAQAPISFASLFSAKTIVGLIFDAFARALALPLQVAPAAFAYRQIARASGAGSTVA